MGGEGSHRLSPLLKEVASEVPTALAQGAQVTWTQIAPHACFSQLVSTPSLKHLLTIKH